YCGQWSDANGWLHILSDIATFGAYAAIPLVLVYFIRKRKDVPFSPIFWLFGAFIFSCGFTHLIEATIFWHPWYRLSGLLKAVTAVASWITVIALIRVIPSALALPGLEKVNRRLGEEIAQRQRVEEAHRVSEERLKLAAEAGRVGIWDWNLVSNTLVWDDAMFALYGTRREDFSGAYAAWTALLHPEDRAASEAASRDAVAGRKDYPIQFRVIWPDGSVHQLEAHGRVFRDEADKPVRMVGTNVDITARKRSEEAVARLAAIVESSHDALFGEDLNGIITSWNPGAEQIFGYHAEEIVGTSIMRLIPAAQRATELELQRQIAAGELGGTFESIRLTKEGREFPASITIAPLKDAAGKVIGTSRVLRDITERKQVEETLRENAAVFSSLIAQAPMGTYVVDSQFRMRQINAEAMPAFGSVHPLIGRDFQEVVEILWGPEVGGQIAGIFRHTLATGERYISPPFTKQRHDLGIEQTYEWQIQRVTLPEGQRGVVCYFHEVTERARATEALRASQERMRLAAEATGVGIWEWNVVTNAIRWDALMFRIYGIEPTPDGFVHYQDWRGAVLPEDLAENEAIIQDTVRRAGHSTREFRIHRRSDGECRHIQAVETVRKNTDGGTEWVVGTNLDITEHKRAEEAVRVAGERFRFMAEAMPQKVCTTQHDGSLDYLNARWHEFLGPTTLENLQKLGWQAVIHPDDVEETLRRWRACLDSGKNLEVEHRVRNHEGKYRWHLTRSQPLRDGEGKITLWISTNTDIDDMMQAQEELIKAEQQLADRAVQLEALVAERTAKLRSANAQLLAEAEERKRLEAEVAFAVENERERLGQELHDGTVQELTGIGMMLSVLERQMRKDTPVFANEAARLYLMIEDAHGNARDLAKNFYPVELEQHGLLAALESIAERTCKKYGVSCVVQADEHSTSRLRGVGAVQLFRIAQEAVQNAAKHAQAQKIVIRLDWHDDAWLLRIEDDGIGLPEDAQQTGGMGLRIMQYRARIIRGRLTVRNNEHGGLLVSCSAPAAQLES
ncbi:MAG: PAS domain S-box protein, partial [Gloeobacteraceae cyanobacterium ES-bin-144]|nr:PAS domain S-box protein [Verrucomicrobiales bacterium]